jgi:hypothetical protein
MLEFDNFLENPNTRRTMTGEHLQHIYNSELLYTETAEYEDDKAVNLILYEQGKILYLDATAIQELCNNPYLQLTRFKTKECIQLNYLTCPYQIQEIYQPRTTRVAYIFLENALGFKLYVAVHLIFKEVYLYTTETFGKSTNPEYFYPYNEWRDNTGLCEEATEILNALVDFCLEQEDNLCDFTKYKEYEED